MGNDLQKRSRAQEEREASKPLDVTVRSARLDAREIELNPYITLDEIRLIGSGIRLASEAGGSIRVEKLDATIVLTESQLNRFLEGRSEDSLSDLEVAMLNGKARITGRYRVLGIPVPFTVTAVPEIEGGARLRLDPRRMSVVGAPLPGFGVELIGEKINSQLARVLDVTRLSIPVRLTGLTMETGRLLLTATTSLELRR